MDKASDFGSEDCGFESHTLRLLVISHFCNFIGSIGFIKVLYMT